MAATFPGRKSDSLLVRVGTSLRAVPNASFTLYRAGTSTKATIYSNRSWAIANTNGSVTTDDAANWSVLLDPQYEYELEYKGNRYPAFSVAEDGEENAADVAAHAALTGDTHGLNGDETFASQEWVTDALGSAAAGNQIHTVSGDPDNGLGIDGDYAYDPTTFLLYGPKAAGIWTSSTSLKGPQGDPGDSGALSNVAPLSLGSASAGISAEASRADHRHALPTAAQVGAANVAGPFQASTTGATTTNPLVGGTTSGAPVSGTFSAGNWVIARDGVLWLCTTSGTPGSWVAIARLSSSAPANISTSASAGTAVESARADHVHSDSGLVRSSQVGANNGVAGLDGSGDLVTTQLPSVVVRKDTANDLGGNELSGYRIKVITVSGTTYPATKAESGCLYRCTNAAGCTITFPLNPDVGNTWGVLQAGALQVTVAAAAGAGISEPDNHLKTAKIGAQIDITCTNTNSYAVSGYTA